ncbi:MAG: 4-deoxy-4-formamido-L-arabinose-phosphoundecaprenol deformylase [Gammaproteobacteria bacterium]
MMLIGLKVDVDTLRGTLEGAPALARLFERRGIKASFLFSVGPDHTGRALRRLLKPGFFAKVLRTSVPSTYGVKTLAYGTLLPGPHIGHRAAASMRAIRDAGFEVGLHSYDHVRWQDSVAHKGAEWTCREWRRGVDAYQEVFGSVPTCFGAAGWQINATVLELEEAAGLNWASDTRGERPFLPRKGARTYNSVQLPTSLPTMDELIGRNGVSVNNVGARLATEVQKSALAHHVFTLHAELEGGPLLAQFEQALDGWKALGAEFCPLGSIVASLDRPSLPMATIERKSIPGRVGKLAVQGVAAPTDRATLAINAGEKIA